MKTEYASLATINAQLVQELLTLVILVKISEKCQIVNVQKDGIMMKPTPYVNNVYQNVLHV
jgi:predicted amino acid-binding ACT domain protein